MPSELRWRISNLMVLKLDGRNGVPLPSLPWTGSLETWSCPSLLVLVFLPYLCACSWDLGSYHRIYCCSSSYCFVAIIAGCAYIVPFVSFGTACSVDQNWCHSSLISRLSSLIRFRLLFSTSYVFFLPYVYISFSRFPCHVYMFVG
jgi:hypothetical protein